MGTEPGYRSIGSASSTLICPKCGYEQEERLDCRKCGIVFSKYYALYSSGNPAASSGPETPGVQDPVENDRKAAPSDLQLQIRELSARFAEVEFEKAERNQLRNDLKSIERRVKDSLESMAARLETCEERFEEQPPPPIPISAQELGIPSLLERLQRVEGMLESLNPVSRQISELDKAKAAGMQQMLELQAQHSALREEVSAIKSQLETFRKAPRDEGSRAPLEEDVHAIRKNLEEFRQILSRPTP